MVSVAAALLIVWAPILASTGRFTLEELAQPFLFPLVVLASAVTVVAVTNTVNGQRKSLEVKDRQLRTVDGGKPTA